MKTSSSSWRNTDQYPLPEIKPYPFTGKYDIYPSYNLGDNQIIPGFESLADIVLKNKIVLIDGYVGVFFDSFRESLEECLKNKGKKTSWISTSDFLKPSKVIEEMVSPFLGGDDPVFGTRTTLNLMDFFDPDLIRELKPDPDSDINIIIVI